MPSEYQKFLAYKAQKQSQAGSRLGPAVETLPEAGEGASELAKFRAYKERKGVFQKRHAASQSLPEPKTSGPGILRPLEPPFQRLHSRLPVERSRL